MKNRPIERDIGWDGGYTAQSVRPASQCGRSEIGSGQPAVSLKNVSCTLPDGTLILDDVNLDIKRGECVLLCGKSGSGKTTVTKCINGLIPVFEPSVERSGTVRVSGLDIDTCEMFELAKRIGSVFQNPKSQFFNLTSNDELAFGLEAAGADADFIEERIKKTVRALHAEQLLDRNVTKMSGGEKQSLVFASVDVMDPDLYVLDEPTANLDADAIRILHDQIAAIRDSGKTIIVAEHRLYFMADLIDRAIYIDGGKIVREFSPAEILGLSTAERASLGLRAVDPIEAMQIGCPRASVPGREPVASGLSLREFSCMRRGEKVFKPVNFDVERGSVVGLVGANGIGKSTLLRSIAGLEGKECGRVSFDGIECARKRRNHVCSLVMQDVNHQLFSDSTENECQLSAGSNSDHIDEVLRALDLEHLRERHPLALSGGQKQRLAVACALLAGREILLLDEPTSGLDFDHMVEVSMLVRSLSERNISIIVATHDREFLNRSCDCFYELEGL